MSPARPRLGDLKAAGRALDRRRPGEGVAPARLVGRPDDALALHLLHQRGGAVVADLQAALDVAGRRLAVAGDHGHGLVVELVAPAAFAAAIAALALVFLGGRG